MPRSSSSGKSANAAKKKKKPPASASAPAKNKTKKKQPAKKKALAKKPAPKSKVISHTDDGTPIVNATLTQIRRGVSGSAPHQLVRVPQNAERSRLYAEAARAIGERESLALPYHGGRMWRCVVRVSDGNGASGDNRDGGKAGNDDDFASAGDGGEGDDGDGEDGGGRPKKKKAKTNYHSQTPLFRWYRGDLVLATMPYILDDIVEVRSNQSGKKRWANGLSDDDLDSSDDEWDDGKFVVEPSTRMTMEASALTTSAYEDTCHPAPRVSRTWISPDLRRFASRKSAMAHAEELVRRDLLVDRVMYGYGHHGARLRPVKPTRKVALEAGMVRFLRDGLWVVGQEEMWIDKRRDILLRKQERRLLLPRPEEEGGEGCSAPPGSVEEGGGKHEVVEDDDGMEASSSAAAAGNNSVDEVSAAAVSSSDTAIFATAGRNTVMDVFYAAAATTVSAALYPFVKTSADDENSTATLSIAKSVSSSDSMTGAEGASADDALFKDGDGKEASPFVAPRNGVDEVSAAAVSSAAVLDTAVSASAARSTVDVVSTTAAAVTASDPAVKTIPDENSAAALFIAKSVSSGDSMARAEEASAYDGYVHPESDAPAKQSSLDYSAISDTADYDAASTMTIVVGSAASAVSALDPAVTISDNSTAALSIAITTSISSGEIMAGADVASADDGYVHPESDVPANQSSLDDSKSNWHVDTKIVTPEESDASMEGASKSGDPVPRKETKRAFGTAPPPEFIPSTHYRLNQDQIGRCFTACVDHYEKVMHTVKARSLYHELADGFDVFRERGRGRYDMELSLFDTKEFAFLTDRRKAAWMPIVQKILGEDALLVHKGCFISLPGAETQVYHQDGVHLNQKTHKPCYAINVFIPLVDYDRTNGPTEFCLGSQYLGHENFVKENAYVPCVKAGTPVIFDYRLG